MGDEIKHKIQIMKMKKSMTRLELSIADSTHSQTLQQQQQQQHGLSIVDSDEMLSGDLLYDEMLSEEFIELNDEDLDIQNDEEKNEKSLANVPKSNMKHSPRSDSRSIAIGDYMSRDLMAMRKSLLFGQAEID